MFQEVEPGSHVVETSRLSCDQLKTEVVPEPVKSETLPCGHYIFFGLHFALTSFVHVTNNFQPWLLFTVIRYDLLTLHRAMSLTPSTYTKIGTLVAHRSHSFGR